MQTKGRHDRRNKEAAIDERMGQPMQPTATKRTIRQRARNPKRFPYTFLSLTLILVVGLYVRHYQHTFTPEKWRSEPAERGQIVDDLLRRYELIGMTEEEVTALLGSDGGDGDSPYLSYYLGMERGWISIDTEWLVLRFVDGRVADYSFATD